MYEKIEKIIEKILNENRETLLENEVYEILNILGINTPKYYVFNNENNLKLENLSHISSQKIVLKIISPQIFHKTDIGGVKIVQKDEEIIKNTYKEFKEISKNNKADYVGMIACEFIEYEPGFGREILFGVRWTQDFGHVLTFGIGGVETEVFGKILKEEYNVYNDCVTLITKQKLENNIKETILYKKISGKIRGSQKVLEDKDLIEPLWKLCEFAKYFSPYGKSKYLLKEMEFNPLVITKDRKLVVLDAILRFTTQAKKRRKPNIKKIDKLLHPKTVGIVGVSGKTMNMGRIILNNLLEKNFDKEKIYIIKPGTEEIDGCKCYPEISKLPEKVDLFVNAVNAAETPKIIKDILEYNKSESVIIIPGGMGEKEEGKGKEIEKEIKDMIYKMEDPPVIVGGNCLGIYSYPGRYNTFFIPHYKLPLDKEAFPTKIAFISQSGAFVITKMSKFEGSFYYAISTGNQIDLSTSDYLAYFLERDDIEIIAFYVEGFNYLDGLEFTEYIQKAKDKQIIFYKAGRTTEGKSAAMGHTASIAGDYEICKKILKQSGVYWAESFEEFEEILKLFALLKNKEIKGKRVGFIGNAGFETVGMADNSKKGNIFIEIPSLKQETKQKIEEVYKKGRLKDIANIRNPLDLTPVANDKVYEECIKIFIETDYIDNIIVSMVPLSPSNNTLSKSEKHKEDIEKEDSFANRVIKLSKTTNKPIIAVVDSGKLYDPLVTKLEKANIPVFRHADKATFRLAQYLNYILF